MGELTTVRPPSQLRKLKKLGRHPVRFVRDFFAKRADPHNLEKTRVRFFGVLDRQLSVGDSLQDGLRYVGRTAGAPAHLLVYHARSLENPFKELLYRSAPEHGYLPVPSLFLEPILQDAGPLPSLFHLHWLSWVLADASRFTPRERVQRFVAQLDRLKARGIPLVWTLHNVLPHGAVFRELEIELRQRTIERVDAIHIMTEHVFEQVAPYYDLPREKTFLCPHPSYEGAYPNYVPKHVARFNLNLHPEGKVFAFFGSIENHKGIMELGRAFRQARRIAPARLQLLIAGMRKDEELARKIFVEFGGDEGVVMYLRKVKSDEVQYFLNAADYVVCPYRCPLNSGVALLAQSFGVPVIGPNQGAFRELLQAGSGIGYEPGSDDGLALALCEAATRDLETFREPINAFLGERQPQKVSSRFFTGLADRLAAQGRR